MILIKELKEKSIGPENCELYVTVEPCLMCCSAIEQAGIKKVYYVLKNEKFGMSLSKQNYSFEAIQCDILRDEFVKVLKDFYD